MVGLKPKLLIGLYCVQATILKLVSLKFGHQANASSLLHFVDQDSCAGLRNQGERHLKLLAAIAAERTEDIAGKALRVDPHQRRRRMNITHNQSYGGLGAPVLANVAFKTQEAEMSPACGEIGFSPLVNCGTHFSIIGRTSSTLARAWRSGHRIIGKLNSLRSCSPVLNG